MTRRGKPRHPNGWDVDGIEREDRFVTLLYNEPAEVLIAQFERMVAGGRYPVRSIYMKRLEEDRYTKVFGTDELSSAFHVVTASKRPVGSSTCTSRPSIVGLRTTPAWASTGRTSRESIC